MKVDEPCTAAIDLLRASGAEKIEHPGGDLFNHLLRTEQILRGWNESEPVCRAGLCHAFYGTAGFPIALLPLDERYTLRSVIGEEAERLVYEYCACDRRMTYPALRSDPVAFVDRFTGVTTSTRSVDLRAFGAISIANELDLVRAGAFDERGIATIRQLCTTLEMHAPEAAASALREMSDHDPL